MYAALPYLICMPTYDICSLLTFSREILKLQSKRKGGNFTACFVWVQVTTYSAKIPDFEIIFREFPREF